MNLGWLVEFDIGVVTTMTKTMLMTTIDIVAILNWLTLLDLKMMAKSKLLNVMLHCFLLFQAKSPKGGKSKTHCTALQAFNCPTGGFEEKACEGARDARFGLLG